MTNRRKELHLKLCSILGSKNVYYDPPETLKMIYPCIRYTRDEISSKHADNKTYISMDRYEVTFIAKDPDDDTVYKMLQLPACSYTRHYVSDNLHHDVFTIYHK